MNKFRIQGKNFFLTFPNTPNSTSFEDIINTIKLKEKWICYILISAEKHKNGLNHYHIFLSYSKRKNIQNARYFDYIFNKHGDYQKVKYILESIKYIKKHHSFSEGGVAPKIKSHQIKEVLTLIKEGSLDTHTVIKDDKLEIVSLFSKFNQLDRFERRLERVKFEEKQRSKQHIKSINLDKFQDSLYDILKFVNHNLGSRNYKTPMLHIGSKEPNMGKTSLTNLLSETTSCYQWPDDMGFQHYSNNLYQFIIGDEFTLTGWQIPLLNRFFAGNPMILPMKGNHAYKNDNPLIIMTSNMSLEDHLQSKFQNSSRLKDLYFSTLIARIHEIEVKTPLFMDYHLGKSNLLKSIKR